MTNLATETNDLCEKKRLSLAARLEPFDSFWQAPENVDKGYASFRQYYVCNVLKHLPDDNKQNTLVVSCGPGYFVSLLKDMGCTNVLGIDSDPEKVKHAQRRGLNCIVAEAFPYLSERTAEYDLIVCEQELNHLTKSEMIDFLKLCHDSLKPKGVLFVYGLNGANPITGAEAFAQNLDHFSTFTEYSLRQALELADFVDIRVIPLNLYVFYKNPLNYVGMCATACLHFAFWCLFKLYGKSNRIFTKKIGSVAVRSEERSPHS